MPAQLQQGNSELRLERPDLAEEGALFTLIEELLGQEKQVPWAGGAPCPIAYIRDVKVFMI
jgi:hypothetical protein